MSIAEHLAQKIFQDFGCDPMPKLVIKSLMSVESTATPVLRRVLEKLEEPEEIEITDPCRMFPPTGYTTLKGGRWFIKDQAGKKIEVVGFVRPLDPDGWAYWRSADDKAYPIDKYKAFRKGGWVK